MNGTATEARDEREFQKNLDELYALGEQVFNRIRNSRDAEALLLADISPAAAASAAVCETALPEVEQQEEEKPPAKPRPGAKPRRRPAPKK